MGTIKNLDEFLKNLQAKLSKEMPRIQKEIKVYENRLSKGELTKNPISGPQFNG